ncbi:hypothetical protein UFOVP1221_19 [uncultured Caudovirales phage]|uniref:Transglycosylase SLT domain-containing protein n=1 Tax=uncultured Caudovirales phage TaxID=2100421 RepID=A0A6J5ME90_9CAUD|nr:hypothetical protein UFOVP491_11 [uncultured Caudovirales phage]CAB4191293.1 hypothetical protein UFOVP1221_19 [uncultured Caudovirales phage]
MSYPQGEKVIHRLWKHAENRRNSMKCRPASVRFMLVRRAAVADSSRSKLNLLPHLCLIAALTSQTMQTATASSYSIDHLKLYAHSRLIDYKEFQCFNKIITKESRWSYRAVNGSHYGLGQMKSKHYRDLDPFRQIDATIRYITNRYQTPCKAWAFHQSRNHY